MIDSCGTVNCKHSIENIYANKLKLLELYTVFESFVHNDILVSE